MPRRGRRLTSTSVNPIADMSPASVTYSATAARQDRPEVDLVMEPDPILFRLFRESHVSRNSTLRAAMVWLGSIRVRSEVMIYRKLCESDLSYFLLVGVDNFRDRPCFTDNVVNSLLGTDDI